MTTCDNENDNLNKKFRVPKLKKICIFMPKVSQGRDFYILVARVPLPPPTSGTRLLAQLYRLRYNIVNISPDIYVVAECQHAVNNTTMYCHNYSKLIWAIRRTYST